MTTLTGARVLLTGASGGLGRTIAAHLHARGAHLLLSGRDADQLRSLAERLSGSEVLIGDLSDHSGVEAIAEQAGDVDVFVAGAGIPASGKLTTFSVGQLDRALAVNLRSAIVLANHLVPGMVERGRGHIVLLASMHGKLPTALVSVYNATKFGLRGFGLALRQELAGTGVGVSVINPTFVRDAGMYAETGAKTHPLAGSVTPEQVADAVVKAILSDRAEIDVAPLGARLAVAWPRLVGTLARRAGATAVPTLAVEKQRAKR
jgi:short-subunit dehydrogenase